MNFIEYRFSVSPYYSDYEEFGEKWDKFKGAMKNAGKIAVMGAGMLPAVFNPSIAKAADLTNNEPAYTYDIPTEDDLYRMQTEIDKQKAWNELRNEMLKKAELQAATDDSAERALHINSIRNAPSSIKKVFLPDMNLEDDLAMEWEDKHPSAQLRKDVDDAETEMLLNRLPGGKETIGNLAIDAPDVTNEEMQKLADERLANYKRRNEPIKQKVANTFEDVKDKVKSSTKDLYNKVMAPYRNWKSGI